MKAFAARVDSALHRPTDSAGSNDLEKSLSPGSGLHASRLAALDLSNAFLASGNTVYHVSFKSPTLDRAEMFDNRSLAKRPRLEGTGASKFHPLQSFHCRESAETSPLAEIQSIDVHQQSQGSVLVSYSTNLGHVHVVRVDPRVLGHDRDMEERKKPKSIMPVIEDGGFGWHGISFDATSGGTRVASAHESTRQVTVIDVEHQKVAWQRRTALSPTQICWGQSATAASSAQDRNGATSSQRNLLFATSHDCVNVFDTRSHGSGLARRLQPMRGDTLFALAAADNTVVVGGKRGMAYIYDVRKWTLLHRWSAPVKYSMLSLLLSPLGETMYAVGTDYELMCSGPRFGRKARAKKQSVQGGAATKAAAQPSQGASKLRLNHSTGFRGASRWVGASLVPALAESAVVASRTVKDVHDLGKQVKKVGETGDCIMCVCEMGQFYLLQNAQSLAP